MSRSVATIDHPQFINITPYNPLISQCEIKVLYVGTNRNRSYISKEVAAEMANSLPGSPIVGYFKEEKQDFGDHGQRITIDGEGVKFETLTKPYGFVAPDAQVWFQTFEDTDEFGNSVIREYLMTTGFLWTGQFPEAQRVIDKGNNQSMELDEETLKGKWATDNNTGLEFFIINDAIFSKLAILGEDVEPCFEGASITAPDVSKNFTLENTDFSKTLFSMMQDLQNAINSKEGGLNMELENQETHLVEDVALAFELAEAENAERASASEEESAAAGTEEEIIEDENVEEEEEEVLEEEQPEENFALLQSQLEELQTKFAALEAENADLKEFKVKVEDEKKDELIKSFYMLSDEDKKDVITNKSNYSLEEIESKLAVICVRNKVSFEKEDAEDDTNVIEGSPAITFNLEDAAETVPVFVDILRKVKKD